MVGHINPRCRRCRKTAMEIARDPLMPCRVVTLPFDEKPSPAQAELPITEKRAS